MLLLPSGWQVKICSQNSYPLISVVCLDVSFYNHTSQRETRVHVYVQSGPGVLRFTMSVKQLCCRSRIVSYILFVLLIYLLVTGKFWQLVLIHVVSLFVLLFFILFLEVCMDVIMVVFLFHMKH